MPDRPAGAIELGPIRKRVAAVRAAAAKPSSLTDQDIRLDLYEHNHQVALTAAKTRL